MGLSTGSDTALGDIRLFSCRFSSNAYQREQMKKTQPRAVGVSLLVADSPMLEQGRDQQAAMRPLPSGKGWMVSNCAVVRYPALECAST